MRIEITRRNTGRFAALIAPLFAVAVTFVLSGLLLTLSGYPALATLRVIFVEPLTDVWAVHELLLKASPLILIAVGLCVCFRSNNWNIGAEGQFILGALFAGALPVLVPSATGGWILPAMMILGMIGGAAWASIPAMLKNRFGTSDVLVSLMLVYVAELLLDWLVRGPWRNPQGFNFPETRSFGSNAIIPEIVSTGDWGGRTNWGIVIAIVAAIGVWFLLSKTVKGFEITVTGASERAARFGGFDGKRTTLFAFLLSGALAGLAGMIEVSGAIGQLRPSISPGYGFAAIIVAFLARLNPLGTILAGAVLALTYIGGEAAQLSLGVSERMARVIQGVLLCSVLAADVASRYRVRFVGESEGSRAATEGRPA